MLSVSSIAYRLKSVLVHYSRVIPTDKNPKKSVISHDVVWMVGNLSVMISNDFWWKLDDDHYMSSVTMQTSVSSF